MSNYTFATLAVGVPYNFKVRTLIDCVMTLTKGDLLIITDDVADLTKYITDAQYDMSRISLHELASVSNQKIWFKERKFNFNLKMLPTKIAYQTGDYDLIIHADADGFMIGWDEEDIQRFINDDARGLIARFRNRPCEETGMSFMLEPKATALGIELIKIKAPMPIEVFLFFKPKCPNFQKFMTEWEAITNRCHDRGVNPFIEALELSYAMSQASLDTHQILSYMRIYPVLNSFRYLHHDKIMRII